MNAFWASENFDAFIVFRSSQPGRVRRKTLTRNDPVFRDQITAQRFSASAVKLDGPERLLSGMEN